MDLPPGLRGTVSDFVAVQSHAAEGEERGGPIAPEIHQVRRRV